MILGRDIQFQEVRHTVLWLFQHPHTGSYQTVKYLYKFTDPFDLRFKHSLFSLWAFSHNKIILICI